MAVRRAVMHFIRVDEADIAGIAAHPHSFVHVAVDAVERDSDHIGLVRMWREDVLAEGGREAIEVAMPRHPPEMSFILRGQRFATE
jgi:hypothetical protein